MKGRKLLIISFMLVFFVIPISAFEVQSISPADLYNWPANPITDDGQKKEYFQMHIGDSNVYFTYMTPLNESNFNAGYNLTLLTTTHNGTFVSHQLLAANITGEPYSVVFTETDLYAVWRQPVNKVVKNRYYILNSSSPDGKTENEVWYELYYAHFSDLTDTTNVDIYKLTESIDDEDNFYIEESVFDPVIELDPNGDPMIVFSSYGRRLDTVFHYFLEGTYTIKIGYFDGEEISDNFMVIDAIGNQNPYNLSSYVFETQSIASLRKPQIRFHEGELELYWNYESFISSTYLRYMNIPSIKPQLEDILFSNGSIKLDVERIASMDRPSLFLPIQTRIVDDTNYVIYAGDYYGGVQRSYRKDNGLWISRFIDDRNTAVYSLDGTETDSTTGDFVYVWSIRKTYDPPVLPDFDVYMVNYAEGEWERTRITLTEEVPHYYPQVEYVPGADDQLLVAWVQGSNWEGDEQNIYFAKQPVITYNTVNVIQLVIIIVSVGALIALTGYLMWIKINHVYLEEVEKREIDIEIDKNLDPNKKINPDLWKDRVQGHVKK
ncbi:MAG: hypothetical protein ACTSYA_03670 [Candidatus Kariarchaeaceae archaeon]